MTQRLHSQLQTISEEMKSATELARQLASTSDEDAFHRRPGPGSWSVHECLEHLSITTKAYLPLLDAALGQQPPERPSASHRFRMDWMGRLLTWSMEPPIRMKMKTPPPFEPTGSKPQSEVIEEFIRLQDELAARVNRSSGLDLGAIRIVSPFSSNVKYNLYSAYCLLMAHQRRHLWQAQQIMLHKQT